jgi:hypothetical protein
MPLRQARRTRMNYFGALPRNGTMKEDSRTLVETVTFPE